MNIQLAWENEDELENIDAGAGQMDKLKPKKMGVDVDIDWVPSDRHVNKKEVNPVNLDGQEEEETFSEDIMGKKPTRPDEVDEELLQE